MVTQPLEPRFLSFLYYFNVVGDFFQCHEYLESLWLDSGRPEILQGLIQTAVCLYHLENGNVRGARRMWARAKPRLEAQFPEYGSIRLNRLVQDMDDVFAKLPPSLTDRQVTVQTIRDLGLPRVLLQFADSGLDDKLQDWVPKPLVDR